MGQPYKTNVILYMATCDVTGKHYVGITHRSLARRRGEHIHAGISANKPHPFTRAIRKHGPGAFKWKIVQTFMFPEDAAAAEEVTLPQFLPRLLVVPQMVFQLAERLWWPWVVALPEALAQAALVQVLAQPPEQC